MQSKYRLIAITVTLLLLVSIFGWAAAQSEQPNAPAAPQADLGSGFTYQGYLELDGQPVNGVCDFQFSLWDGATAGVRFGSLQEVLALPVTGGRFTAILNASAEFNTPFYGKAVWLEIAVRCPAGSGSYTALSPRQALTAVPYAFSLAPDASIYGPTYIYGPTDGSDYGLQVYAPESYSGVVSEGKWRGISGLSIAHVGVRGSGGSNGVFGIAFSDGGYGVEGQAIADNGIGVYGLGRSHGVYGSTYFSGGYGVEGRATAQNGIGVRGIADASTSVGVAGGSTDGAGGYFQSSAPCCDGAAVKVWNTTNGIGLWAATGSNAALYGQGRSSGVVGEATANGGIGIVGRLGAGVTSGLAGQFLGNVDVTGSVLAPVTTMRIDHPLDPANQFLSQANVTAPEMTSQYSGNIVTDASGFAVVALPAYAEALNSDFRYNLTVIGQFAQAIVASKIQDGQFTIQTDLPNVEVSWLVIGVRRDPYALGNPLQVEAAKTGAELGRYLYPQGYGLGAESGLDALYSLSAQATGSPQMDLAQPSAASQSALPVSGR